MWSFTLTNAGGQSAGTQAAILDVIQDAADYWGRYIDFGPAVIDVDVEIVELPNLERANALVTFIQPGSTGTFFASALEEIRTRSDVNDLNGPAAEFTIQVDLGTLNAGQFYLGGEDALAGLPSGDFDLYTFMIHEIAHGLGLISATSGADQSSYDELIDERAGRSAFIGANASALLPSLGYVPLAAGDLSHIDNSILDVTNAVIASGRRMVVSELNIAMLEDLGLPILGATTGNDTLFGFENEFDGAIYVGGHDTIDLLSGNDLFSGLSGDDVILGGSGADTLIGGEGSDNLTGGADADQLIGDQSVDVDALLLSLGL